jgi:enterochelin esterase family protein
MNTLAQEAEYQARRGQQAFDAWLAERSVPIVDGRSVTFVWRGEADEVLLRHWIHGLAGGLPFHRVHGTQVWLLSIDVPEGSRVEYKLEIARWGERRLVADALNQHAAADPYGANSVVHGHGYTPPEWILPDSEARAGELRTHHLHSQAFGGERRVQVYLPARFRTTRRYPLLVVHDGEEYLRFAAFKTVLDNLIHRLEIPSMVVALTQSHNRLEEYADDPRHARYLVEELVPELERLYPLVQKPSARGLMGASFGAVASLSTAWRHPGYFGNVLLQSGSFVFTDIGNHDRGPLFDPVVKFVNAFRKHPGRPTEHLYMSCGVYESLIYYNRSLVPLLQKSGMTVKFSESHDGHNWENWRDRLREGLSWLYPGPLFMVYE